MAWNVGKGHCEIEKGEMNTRSERGGGSLNKVASAHFDPFDLLKLNYSDPRTLEHEAAEAAVYSGRRKKKQSGDRVNLIILLFFFFSLTETDKKDNLPTPCTRCC